jgi:predicted permease
MTIIGVAARGFEGTTLGASPDVFVPFTTAGQMYEYWGRRLENRKAYWAYLFARLKPEVTIDAARAELNTLYQSIVNEVEAPLQSGMSEQTMERFRAKDIIIEAEPRGQSSLHEEVQTPLTLLLATTGVVLLIACANIANLLLARGANRSMEMALRGSLGASRRQLATQLLTESCLLAVMGGVASLVVARWTLGAIASILPPEAATMVALELRPSVMFFAGALSIGTGLLFGMYPALHSTRPDLMTVLRGDSGQPSGARAAARFRGVLVTAQIALSMALLFAAGLFIKSLMNVSRVELGLNAQNVVTFGISPELNGWEPERSQAGVSAGVVALLEGSNWGTDVSVQGFESGPDIDDNSRLNKVGASYFSTLGMPLLAGREFTRSDAANAPKVAIVNEVFTNKFGLNGRDAVGKWMSTTSQTTELDIQIVGVIGDTKYADVKQDTPPLFFTPYRQDENVGAIIFYVRTSLEPGQLLRAIPGVIRQLDPNLPVEDLKTLEQQVKDNVVLDRLISMLSAAFAILATLLAAVGLYGVLAFTVAQRTREFGLRMALGADGSRVRGMVLRHVGRMTAIGGAIGLVAALGLGRAAQSILFELEGHDPMVVAALGAGYVPALRASKVDPMRALRYE